MYKIAYAIYNMYISTYFTLTNDYTIKILVKCQNKNSLSLNHSKRKEKASPAESAPTAAQGRAGKCVLRG